MYYETTRTEERTYGDYSLVHLVRTQQHQRGREAKAGGGIEMYVHENVQLSNSISVPSRLSKKKWTRPPNNVLKLNVDGSFKLNDKAGSWGFLIRDSDGDLVMVGRGKIDNLLSAFQSELIACLQELQTAADLGIA